ncbi:replication/maintenance protein RepL [Escherichia coli]|uniref:replication/maintenance protein RepL n=1 Tax=Escherichia coli TaxID=562 RepID=UPI003318E5CA
MSFGGSHLGLTATKNIIILSLSAKLFEVCMSVVRYKENPFIKDLALTISSKRVMISPMGKDEHVLVNQSTGEVTGTNVVTYKKVDSEEFVKLFSRNIALTFELTSSGIKSLNVLIWSVQNTAIQKDVVALDQLAFDDFMKENPNLKMTLRTFQRGLSELESSKIIAKTMRKGFYYINPNFVFNGDRIAFTTLIERK